MVHPLIIRSHVSEFSVTDDPLLPVNMSRSGVDPSEFYLNGAERGLVKQTSAVKLQGPIDVEERAPTSRRDCLQGLGQVTLREGSGRFLTLRLMDRG